MEIGTLDDLPALIDLSTVDEARRSALWASAAPSIFPGLSVDMEARAPAGDIRCVEMGAGTLWSVRSSSALVTYLPFAGSDDRLSFSLLLQIDGVTQASQRERRCGMEAGDICLLDERHKFLLDVPASSEILFLRMPRSAALSRNPQLEHRTAIRMPSSDAGVSLLAETLLTAFNTVPFMRDHQRQAALTAIIHMLGVADTIESEAAGRPNWRIEAALAFIELNFASPGLSAETVAQAQRISRRRLDQLMIESIGASITSSIWNRRLQQAANDLRDALRASWTVAEIAFANGFEDPAHFARSFKRRYDCSPLRWRERGLPQ